MKYLIIILLIFLKPPLFSQNEPIEFRLSNDSDTAFWLNSIKERIALFNLQEIDHSNADFVFRSWFPGSLLEIKKSNIIITASVTYMVIDTFDSKSTDIFTKEYPINDETAKFLYRLVIENGIQEIPSDKFIKNWSQGLDGIVYVFEQKDRELYSFKHYWSPEKGMPEAEFILDFTQKLFETVEEGSEFFTKDNPFVSYRYYGQSYEIVKILSRKELREYKRKRAKLKNGN